MTFRKEHQYSWPNFIHFQQGWAHYHFVNTFEGIFGLMLLISGYIFKYIFFQYFFQNWTVLQKMEENKQFQPYYRVWNVSWIINISILIHRRNHSGCEKAKNVGFLPFILWVFLTIYICVALMKINMCFKQLEANHIMSCDRW